MDIKKLVMIALAAGSLTVFVGCGDDNGDGGGGGGGGDGGATCEIEVPACDIADDVSPTATCLEDAAAEESQNIRVTSITIPPSAEGVGFNLDCFNTTPTDAFGCRKADAADGVDNALAALAPLLVQLDVDLNQQISDGIGNGYDGTIQFNIVVGGWNGEDEDDCVVLGLEDSTTGTPVADPVAAVVEGGVVKAVVEALPLVIPFGDPGEEVLLSINIQNARVELPIDGNGVTDGFIAGHVIWEEEGAEDDLESLVRQVIEDLDSESITFDTAANLIIGLLDMHAAGVSEDACSCDALSVGLKVSGENEL